MIESIYWKKDLLLFAKKFSPVKKPSRWSEKRLVNFEKDIFICFSLIRKLIESNKFTDTVSNRLLNIFRSPAVKHNIHKLNSFKIYDNYDYNKEHKIKKSLRFICNQIIHSEIMFAYREEDKNWGGVFTFSDYERSKYIYRIPIKEVIELLKEAGNDFITSSSYTYSKIHDDWVFSAK